MRSRSPFCDMPRVAVPAFQSRHSTSYTNVSPTGKGCVDGVGRICVAVLSGCCAAILCGCCAGDVSDRSNAAAASLNWGEMAFSLAAHPELGRQRREHCNCSDERIVLAVLAVERGGEAGK
jgi:hypothetical protein